MASSNIMKPLAETCRSLGSLKLAVALLAVLATVIGFATILETDFSRDHAHWYVYRSSWFLLLLGLLATNIFFAAANRWPWKRYQTGFVVTHAGLLVLLAGAMATFLFGVEGQVTLTEGQTTSKMVIPGQSQVTAKWVDKPEEPPYEFRFAAGPSDWRTSTTLNLGAVDDVGMRVIRYIRNAVPIEKWVKDESGAGGPVATVRLDGPRGSAIPEYVLSDQGFGDEVNIGPIRIQLQSAAGDGMLKAFVAPALGELGAKGLLLVHDKGPGIQIPVDENLGKTIPLATGDFKVELVAYLPNAKPDAQSRFTNNGDEPRNPMLELKVHFPDGREPMRQIVFAKSALLNLDQVYGQPSPIKFEYHHPAIKASSGCELLKTKDGKLHCRVVANGEMNYKGLVSIGDRIELTGGFALTLVDYLENGRQLIAFAPEPGESPKNKKGAAAAEIEVAAGGVTAAVWLQQNHPEWSARKIATPQGILELRFGFAEMPLGFSLQLLEFTRTKNPGGLGNATFASTVRVIDEKRGFNEDRPISMNEPLTHRRLTFYQSSFSDSGHGLNSSTFSVAYDPGRLLKYGGSLLICLGIAIMFYMKAYFFSPRKREGQLAARTQANASPANSLAMESTDAPPSESSDDDLCFAEPYSRGKVLVTDGATNDVAR